MKHLLSTFLTLFALLAISCGSEDAIPDGIIPSNEYFKVVGDTITINGQATEASFPIAADCAWSIVTNGWDDLHATPDHGEGNQTVKIVTSANDTPRMRNGTLTITTSDGIKKVITILHLAGNIQLNVSQTEVNFGINGGSTEVAVTSNTSWTVAGGTDWCKVDKTSGTGNGTFIITAAKSDEKEARKATFSVTPQGSTTPVIITVVQSNKDIDLAVSPARLTFDANPTKTKELDIICNDRWTATVSDDWLMIDRKEGSNSATIHVSCEDNTTGAERTATITLRSNGLKETATVTQRNFNAEFAILTTLQEFPAAGGTQTVTIQSNIEWTVSGENDWCHLAKTDNSVVVTVDVNTEQTPRTADLIFTTTDFDPVTLTVVQREAGAEPPIVYNLSITDNYDGKATLTAVYRSTLPVTEYGFVYATHEAPTLYDTKVAFPGSSTTGNMTATLTGLTIGTTYYVRAYAISAVGPAYSDELSFEGQGREPGQDDNGTPTPARKR